MTGRLQLSTSPRCSRPHSGSELQLLYCIDLLGRVESLGAGMRAVLDGVAAVQLELVVDGVEALLCELITAVLDPPGRTNVFISLRHYSRQPNAKAKG